MAETQEKATDLVTLTIDGKETQVPKGMLLIDAIQSTGIHVPHFCYHPDLSVAGNCRMCQVEIEGTPKLQISCNTYVTDGMVVHTNNDSVKQVRKAVLEFLLLNHPIDCPICDQAGECKLQDYYMDHGLYDSRMDLDEKIRKDKVVDLGPRIVLDQERCVLCSRCIRFCDEITKTGELAFFQRGAHEELGTYKDRPLDNPYAGNVVDICPVGALTSRDFRFKCRVWFLKSEPSVCPHCSTGCNVRLDQNENEIHRIIPRRNTEVNDSWICDIGRLSYREVLSPDRMIAVSHGRGDDLTAGIYIDLLKEAAQKMKAIAVEHGPESVAVIGSPRMSNESLFLLHKLAREAYGTPHLDFRVHETPELIEEREDDVLRRKDHNPNSRGAYEIGLLPSDGGLDTRGILDAIDSGKIKGLHLVERDLVKLFEGERDVSATLAKLELFIVQSPFVNETTSLAHYRFPTALWAEEDGTYTNYQRRVQKYYASVRPQGEARSDRVLLFDFLKSFDLDPGDSTADGLFDILCESAEAFRELDYDKVGELGATL